MKVIITNSSDTRVFGISTALVKLGIEVSSWDVLKKSKNEMLVEQKPDFVVYNSIEHPKLVGAENFIDTQQYSYYFNSVMFNNGEYDKNKECDYFYLINNDNLQCITLAAMQFYQGKKVKLGSWNTNIRPNVPFYIGILNTKEISDFFKTAKQSQVSGNNLGLEILYNKNIITEPETYFELCGEIFNNDIIKQKLEEYKCKN